MALRCLGWSWELPASRTVTGTTRTAEQPAGFSSLVLSPSVRAGKKVPFGSNFKVVVDFQEG